MRSARTLLLGLALAAGAVAGLVHAGATRAGPQASCTQHHCATGHDLIPNFAARPTIRSVRSGNWSEPSTWRPARVPAARDVVLVGHGTTVTFDARDGRAGVVGIGHGGAFRFRPDSSTRLTVGTLIVLPGGALTIGTAAAPVQPGVRAELVLADRALDLSRDPYQFGTGLIAVDGRLELHGAARTPFARLAREPRAGDRELRLAQPVEGWRAGDRVVLPDSRQWASETDSDYVYRGERPTVARVSPDGRVVGLRVPLRFDHPGARDGNGKLDLLPHAGNLTRNVVVRSQRPTGTRGHVLATGRSAVDIRHAAFLDLGRTTVDKLDLTRPDAKGRIAHVGTNQAGRYPLHVHHLAGPRAPLDGGVQFRLEGNVVDDAAAVNRHKWAITVHDSHHGLVRGNVVHNAAGWGIGTETGNETANVIERNLVVKVGGQAGGEHSESGTGIWLRGPLSVVRDNVVANVARDGPLGGVGYELWFVYLGEIAVPRTAGADTAIAAQARKLDGNAQALAGFAGNEVYGVIETGLQVWWLGTRDTKPLAIGRSVIRDLRIWHHSRYGVYGYPSNRLAFDGVVVRGDRRVLANRHEFVLGLWFGDYMSKDVTIRRADIQNMRTGIVTPSFGRGRTTIERSFLRNARNIAVPSIGAPGSAPHGPSMPPKETLVRDVRFRTVRGDVDGMRQCAVSMDYTTHNGAANLVGRDSVTVRAFDGRRGDDFRVFYAEQRPDFVLPVGEGNLAAAPAPGLTNAQAWARYRLAVAGEVADGASRRSGICGLVRRLR